MVTEYIKRGWEAYRKNFESFAGAVIISMFATAAPIILGMFAFVIGAGMFSSNVILGLPLLFIGAALFVTGIILGISLQGGMYAMADESLRKRKTSINTMIETAKRRWKSFVGASLITSLLVFSGIVMVGVVIGIFAIFAGIDGTSQNIILILFAVITGLVIAAFVIMISFIFSLINPAIVSGKGAYDAVKDSYKTARKNPLNLLGVIIITGLIAFAVSASLNLLGILINMFAITPVLYITLTDFYRRNSKRI